MTLFLACTVFCCGAYAKALSEVPEDLSREVTTFVFTDPITEVVHDWNVSFSTWNPPISFGPSVATAFQRIALSGLKTSFIAAVLTLARRPPAGVMVGTLSALILVTVLSAGTGLGLTRSVVLGEQLVSAVLFMMFSIKMLNEARSHTKCGALCGRTAHTVHTAFPPVMLYNNLPTTPPAQSTIADNMEMVSVNVDNPYKDMVMTILRDPDVDEKAKVRMLETRPELKEILSISRRPSAHLMEDRKQSVKDELKDDQKSVDTMVTLVDTEKTGRWKRLCCASAMLWISLEAFGMIFLAEWGDFSQYVTRDMLASKLNVYGVVIGATLGHAVCTLVAVCAGLCLSNIFSQKAATYFGAALFFLLAGVSIVAAFEVSEYW